MQERNGAGYGTTDTLVCLMPKSIGHKKGHFPLVGISLFAL